MLGYTVTVRSQTYSDSSNRKHAVTLLFLNISPPGYITSNLATAHSNLSGLESSGSILGRTLRTLETLSDEIFIE